MNDSASVTWCITPLASFSKSNPLEARETTSTGRHKPDHLVPDSDQANLSRREADERERGRASQASTSETIVDDRMQNSKVGPGRPDLREMSLLVCIWTPYDRMGGKERRPWEIPERMLLLTRH
jgi:hypothetical protein